jgi:glycosyltransferase involved in cell wall biosynthesis
MEGGGAERQLAYLARELVCLGWEVHVAVTRRGPNWARLADARAVIHEIPARHAYDVGILRALHRIIGGVDPDVVQVWLTQMEILGGLAALMTRTPWVLSERSSAGSYPMTVKTLGRQAIAQLATAVISNSSAGDDYWRRRIGRRIHRDVIRNGLPLAEMDAVKPAEPQDLGITSGRKFILFAGRLEPQKNIDRVLAALRVVVARFDVPVLCCGEGSLGGHVETWIARHGLGDRIRRLGFVPDLWRLMKGAAVVVSPSLVEGGPNVVLEAMACGVPLVVSDIPEHREFLDERCALFVDPLSVEQLANAIEATLQDPAAAGARAAQARSRIAHFDVRTTARRYHDVYMDIRSRAV